MASPKATPTTAQQASAEMHLDRRDEWRYIRINGIRYCVMPSGNSGRTYWVRDDAEGCSCLWYIRTLTSCSHMIAVRRTLQPTPRRSLASLMGLCEAKGCQDDRQRGELFCAAHQLDPFFG